jgi:CRISPR-associated endonuclease/helicase Cas3
MLPALADSVVVIDEVHSFDPSMFSALKDFLKAFDVPVLCMTATLPNIRRSELIGECGLEAYESKPGELKTIAEAPRYKLHRVDKAELPERIRTALNEGKRVLWVVNQVKRAQQAAIRLASDFRDDPRQEKLHVMSDVPLFCYHSRFKLSDRVVQHNNVVDGFRADCPAALAITTQVCEMSLDMDADMLVTEECPITSLIQRMGRCNRARQPRGFDRSGEVIVYRADDPKPYDSAALTGVEQFLTDLSRKDSLNQVDLEEALRNAPDLPVIGDSVCSFLKSGPYALGGEEDFREIEEFSRPSLLKADVDVFLIAGKADQPGFVVPVPRKLSKERDDSLHSKLPRYLGVTPDGHYHLALGFCDNLLTQMGGAT